MSTEFLKLSEFDVKNLKFSKSKNNSGRRFLIPYYNKKNLGLKFTTLRVPFNVNFNKFNQLEMCISLGNDSELIDKIKDLDRQMGVYALENEWFKANVEAKYTPMLKQFNVDFPPTIKFKPSIKNGELKTIFFDINKEKIDVKSINDIPKYLVKGTMIQVALECVCVWINENNSYGLTWKAEQIRIISSPQDESTIFQEDSSGEELSEDEEYLLDE